MNDYEIFMKDLQIWDVVYYEPFEWAEKERGIVSSFCEDENYIFIRFKSLNWERTHKSQLSK